MDGKHPIAGYCSFARYAFFAWFVNMSYKDNINLLPNQKISATIYLLETKN